MGPIRVLLLVAALVPVPFGAARAQTSNCTCDDLNNIQNRLANVNNISAAYQRALTNPASFPGLDLNGDFKTGYSNLTKQINATPVPVPYPVNYTGTPASDTNYSPFRVACTESFPDNVSACIVASLHAHEDVHLSACQAWLQPQLANPPITADWRPSMQAGLQEELNAYAAERAYLENQRQQLMCSCPYYALQLQVTEQESLPPVLSISADGGTEIPLKFQNDGGFSGQGALPLNGTTNTPECQGQEQVTANESVSGTIDGPNGSTQMHLDIATGSATGGATLTCFGNTTNIPLDASAMGGKAHADLPAVVGSVGQTVVNSTGGTTTYTETIAETATKDAMTQAVIARVSQNGSSQPGPDALPNCKAP